jgi:hypothetical protein
MAEFARSRLARATRDCFTNTVHSSSADPYVEYLESRGYAASTINVYLEGVAHWCTRHHIGLAGVNAEIVKHFLDKHLPTCRCARRCQRVRHSTRAALVHLLKLLRTNGQIATGISADPAALQSLRSCATSSTT